MVTPPKNDVSSVPLNGEGRKVVASWDLDQDNAAGNQCRAFGAAGVMRLPLRVQVSWQDDRTLKIETDAGQQTRMFRFAAPTAGSSTTSAIGAERTWQGVSTAEWVKQAQSRGLGFGGRGGGDAAGGTLKVVTTQRKGGYLRKNGVPYSEDAVLTEYYNRHWVRRSRMVHRHDGRRGSGVPRAAVHHQFVIQARSGQLKWKLSPCQTGAADGPPQQPAAGGPRAEPDRGLICDAWSEKRLRCVGFAIRRGSGRVTRLLVCRARPREKR
jgi:hypothetical protein